MRADRKTNEAAPGQSGPFDPDSREWMDALRGDRTARDEAVARLHALLLRAARFEVARRRRTLPDLGVTSSTTSRSRPPTMPS
jgi:hypothetical protein